MTQNSLKKIIQLTVFLAILLGINSCMKHDLENCNNCSGEPVTLRLNLAFDTQFMDTTSTRAMTRNHEKYDKIVFAVDIYSVDNEILTTKTFTYSSVKKGKNVVTIDLEAPSEKVTISTWADYDIEDKIYNIDNLEEVKIVIYKEDDIPLNAYAGSIHLDLSGKSGMTVEHTVEMETPFAAFRILATDLPEYLAINPNATLGTIFADISYPSWIPSGFDVVKNEINLYEAQIKFTNRVSSWIDGNSVVIGSDYIFVNKKDNRNNTYDTEVEMDFTLYQKNGTQSIINKIEKMTIPLKKGRLTLVKGAFFTKEMDPPGIGIDDEFEDEEIIILPDL